MTPRTDDSGRPLAAVALALALLLAGCTAVAPAGPSTTPSETPSPPSESPLTPKPLPERPDDLTRATVVEFAEDFEVAYQWNEELDADTLEIAVAPQRAWVLDETADGFVVHLEVGFSKTGRSDGARMVADGFYTANYFVNGTTIRRVQVGGQQRPGPDPRNGTVVG